METILIDINCDVGEGVGNEARLFDHISSCNIACGGHAGDAHSIREIARMAEGRQIKVGAHPSYPDSENFGRVIMDISDGQLKEAISAQMDAFVNVLIKENIRLHHIKPHGALYNALAKNRHLAGIFLDAIEKYRAEAILYAPPASQIADEADRRGFRMKYEAFADRNYNEDLSLVSRKLPNALIEDPEKVARHLLQMVREQSVETVNGKKIPIRADTFCVHGDTPTALKILTYLSEELPRHQVYLKK